MTASTARYLEQLMTPMCALSLYNLFLRKDKHENEDMPRYMYACYGRSALLLARMEGEDGGIVSVNIPPDVMKSHIQGERAIGCARRVLGSFV
jgi:hypothetical protein